MLYYLCDHQIRNLGTFTCMQGGCMIDMNEINLSLYNVYINQS